MITTLVCLLLSLPPANGWGHLTPKPDPRHQHAPDMTGDWRVRWYESREWYTTFGPDGSYYAMSIPQHPEESVMRYVGRWSQQGRLLVFTERALTTAEDDGRWVLSDSEHVYRVILDPDDMSAAGESTNLRFLRVR